MKSIPRSAARLGAALAFLVLAIVPARATTEDKSFADVHRAAVAKYVTALEGLASWSAEAQLYVERDRVWRSILDIDPDNGGARRGLRYSRKPDGTWVEPAPREVKNFNAKALPDVPKKRQAAVEVFRTTMVAAFETNKADDAQKRLVFRQILDGDPDDAFVRAAQGEVKSGDAWILEETVTGKERRPKIKEFVAQALEATGKVFETELTDMEKALGIAFTQHVETKHVRVLGTGDKAECETTARNCEAAGPLIRGVFGIDTEHQPGFTVYLFSSAQEGATFVEKLPGLEPDFRKFLGKVVGVLVPGQPRVAYWDREFPRRIDGASRQTVNDFLDRGFGVRMSAGWAWEGFGLYLNRELAGSRLTWFIQPDSAATPNPLRKRMLKSDSNWMNEAFVLLGQKDHPRFGAMLERDVNAMSVEDVLYAYAFAAYLLEGRPKDAPELLRHVGTGKETGPVAVQAVLHMDAIRLEERLLRWLSERR